MSAIQTTVLEQLRAMVPAELHPIADRVFETVAAIVGTATKEHRHHLLFSTLNLVVAALLYERFGPRVLIRLVESVAQIVEGAPRLPDSEYPAADLVVNARLVLNGQLMLDELTRTEAFLAGIESAPDGIEERLRRLRAVIAATAEADSP